MLSSRARTDFNRLIAEIQEWESSVPRRAVRFIRECEELRAEIAKALPFWWLRIDDSVVNRYKERVKLLREIAQPLIDLLRKADGLESEARDIPARGAGDEELTAWLKEKSNDWRVQIGLLGATAERRIDLRNEERKFLEIEAEVRRHHDAINQLREAERILTTLSSIPAATLAAGLPELRKRLYRDGCTLEWLEDIKKLIQPLKAVADRVQDPPPELRDVSSTLTELRSWSLHLGDELHRDVEDIEERHRFKVIDWEPEEVKELAAEAQRLRATLLEKAAALREEKLRELEQQVGDLRDACGYDKALEERFEELRQRSFNRPHLFQDWLAELARFQSFFKGNAQTKHGALEMRLADVMEAIQERLKALNARPLSAENSAAVLLVEQNVRAFPPAADLAEETLRQLRHANEIAREIERLDRRAIEELDEVERKQLELSERYDALKSEARRVKGVKFDVPDLASQIASLSDAAARVSLEERKKQALALESEIHAVESRFAERCRHRLGEQLLDVQRAVEVLRRAGATPPCADPPEIPMGVAPQVAAQAVLEVRRIYSVLRRMARQVRKELDSRRQSHQTELHRLRTDDLASGDRQESDRLKRELAEESWSRVTDPMAQLKALAILIERCDSFFTRLRREQRNALNRLAELDRNFRDFTEQQLDRFCPLWSERVAALIYGIPKEPRKWTGVQHQLKLATDLFSRVKPQAMRLAAEELETSAESLRQRLRDGVDPSFEQVARNLLAELDAYSQETLPPVNLRMRVFDASQGEA